MKRKYSKEEFKRLNYEVFIWLITALSVLNVLLVLIFRDPIVVSVIIKVNVMLGLILFFDFLYRLHGAHDRRQYFLKDYGWLDLLGGLPILGAQTARVVRFIRTTRLFAASGEKKIFREVITHRANTALLSIAFFVLLLFEFGSIAILYAELGNPNAEIQSVNDALWWVLVTISTVGYGDYVPVTANGRFIATFVIIAGVGVFGTLSGFLAKTFLGEDELREENIKTLSAVLQDMHQLQQQNAELLQQQQAEREEMQEKLEKLENMLQQLIPNQGS